MSRDAKNKKKYYSRSILLRLFPINNHEITCFIKLLMFLQLSPYVTAETGADTPFLYAIGKKLGLSMMIIAVVIVYIILFCGCIKSVSPRDVDEGGGGGGGQSRRVARGLDVEVIKTFPTFVYSTVKALKIGKGSLECAVCLNEFQDHETLRLIPKCSHVFHPDCINDWLVCQTTCPLCRADLVPKLGENSCAIVTQMLDSDSELEHAPNIKDSQNQTWIHTSKNVESPSPDMNVSSPTPSPMLKNQKKILDRSHSIGHSLIQVEENYERFTLKFSEEVESQIINSSSLNCTKSCMACASPRESSSKSVESRS